MIEATFVDGVRSVLAEYDIAEESLVELQARFPVVVTVSPDPGSDYQTDGTADEVEINQATAEVFEAGGGLVYLMAGTYTVGDSVYVWDKTTLKGEGRIGPRRTEIVLADAAPSMSGQAGILRVKKDWATGTDKRVFKVLIEDLVIDGNREGQLVPAPPALPDAEKKYGFYAEGDDIVTRRVTVHSCQGYGFDPHQHEDLLSSEVAMLDSYAYDNLNDGFTLDALANVVIAHNVSRGNGRHGFNIVTGTHDIVLCGNLALENGLAPAAGAKGLGGGIQIQNGSDPSTPVPHSIAIDDCSIAGNGRSGVDLRGISSSSLTNSYVARNGDSGVRLRGADKNLISDNLIELDATISAGAYEIVLGDYDDGTNPAVGSKNNAVRDNTLRSVSMRHISTDPLSIGNTVENNTLE